MSFEKPAMTDTELADAQGRHDAYKRSHDYPEAFACCSAHASADDVPGLLAEVKRAREANYDLAKHDLRTMDRATAAEAEVQQLRVQLAESQRLATTYQGQAKMAGDLLAERDKRLAEIGETTVEWAIRTDSTDHAPDSPHFGSDQKVILNYPMDEQHARKHSKPWGWQAICRVVGQWHNADQGADRG